MCGNTSQLSNDYFPPSTTPSHLKSMLRGFSLLLAPTANKLSVTLKEGEREGILEGLPLT